MSFPTSPANGQTATVNNIVFTYVSSQTAWYRVPTSINIPIPTTASGTGTTTTFVISNTTPSTGTNSGALVVAGGVGIGGNVNIGGTVTGGGIRTTSTSTPPANPTVGDIWYNTLTDDIYRYTSDGVTSAWLDITGPTSTGGGGGGGGATAFTGGTVTNTTTFLSPIIIGIASTSTSSVGLTVGTTDAIVLPSGTTAQRPTSPIPGMIRYNSTASSLEAYLGNSWYTVVGATYSINYLIVAGGGGGAGAGTYTGGGGAGGLITGVLPAVNPGTPYTVVVGAGGTLNNAGSNSSVFGFTAVGGGVGGSSSPSATGGSGGSGGGGGGYWPSGLSGGSGTPGQGNTGGAGYNGIKACGGGGGAGAQGGNGTPTSAGAGGIGSSSTIINSTLATTYNVGQVYNGGVYFAGGGGGGGDAVAQGVGGIGGGGNGNTPATYPASANGSAGTAATGGGGGGGSQGGSGAAGGSGVVLIGYQSTVQKGTGGTVQTFVGAGGTYYVHIFSTSGSFSYVS